VSLYRNGHLWTAQWSDWTGSSGEDGNAADSFTTLLTRAAGSAPLPLPPTPLNWPQLPNGVPVLVMPARNTVNNATAESNWYWRQAAAYAATLSPGRGTLIVANGEHGFVWTDPGQVVTAVAQVFGST